MLPGLGEDNVHLRAIGELPLVVTRCNYRDKLSTVVAVVLAPTRLGETAALAPIAVFLAPEDVRDLTAPSETRANLHTGLYL